MLNQVYKQKNIGIAIPASIGCSHCTSGSISHFTFIF